MPPRDNDSVESLPHQPINYNKSIMSKQKKTPHKSNRQSASRYVSDFQQLSSSNPILASLFKNEEHVTSSLGAIDAASAHITNNDNSSVTLCLVLGEGRTPRTALAASIQNGWSVVSIDERLDEKWINEPRLPRNVRFMGFKGDMSDFLRGGLEMVQFNLCPIATIQEMVVLVLDKDGGYSTLKTIRGRVGVADLKVLYNNVPATVVSITSEENTKECPLTSKPKEVYVDEDILSNLRLVQVWKFERTQRLTDAPSHGMPKSSSSKRRSNKVEQLQRQQDLARANRKSRNKISKQQHDTDDDDDDSQKKRKSKRKSNRTQSTELVPVNDPTREEGLTVSSFLSRQKSMQKQQETYRSSTHPSNDQMLLTNGEDEYRNHSLVSSANPMVDTVPSDHPASSIIQTHRTCTVCHRTLCRSQFSVRDRYLVHLSLGPGAVCRTCSMTVAATKLKMMPSHGQLITDYANRGEYLMKNGQLPALGYAPANDAAAEGALVPHDGNNAAENSNELVPFQPEVNDGGAAQQNPFMPHPPSFLGVDVNAPFSGILPEEERPTHIADCKYIDAVLSMPCYAKLNAMELFASSKDVSVSMAALDAVKLYGTMDAEYFMAHDGNGEKIIPRSMRKQMAGGGKDSPTGINPKSIICLVIGEGSLPRTAVMASLHYGWTTLSIDPTLDEDWDGYQDDVPNYTGYSGTISEFMSDEYTESYFELDNSQSRVNHLVIIGVQKTKDQLRLKGQSNINEIRARYNDIPTTLVSMSPLRMATLAPKRRDGQCGSKLEKDVGYEPNCSYIDEGVFAESRLVEVWNFHNDDDVSDQEGSVEDDEYSRESIDDRNDRYQDRDYEKKFSDQVSLEDEDEQADVNNCSTYQKFQSHVERAEKERKAYDEQKRLYSRKTSANNSLMSGSTLSTKGTMEKRSDKMLKNGAMALPIASRLEEENSRRKKKNKSRRKKSSGPRPIPDDIPEDLEIVSVNFVGSGPAARNEDKQLVEWNTELLYEDNFDQTAGNDAMIERIASCTDNDYKSNANAREDHDLRDMREGAVDNYDDQNSRSGRSSGSHPRSGSKFDLGIVEHEDEISYQSGGGSRSYGMVERNRDERSRNSDYNQGSCSDRDDDVGSYSNRSDTHFAKKDKKVSDLDEGNVQREVDQSDHSSDEFDALRNNAEYYGYDDDQSSNDDAEELTSTNSGIVALNDYNASRNNLNYQSGTEDEDDMFPDYWSEDEELDQKPLSAAQSNSKRKPWHRKEAKEHSFMSSCDSYD